MKMKISRSEVDVFCSVARKKRKKKRSSRRSAFGDAQNTQAMQRIKKVCQMTRSPLGLRQRHGVAPHRCQYVFVFQLPSGGIVKKNKNKKKTKKTQRRLKKRIQLQHKTVVCRRKSNAQLEITPLKLEPRGPRSIRGVLLSFHWIRPLLEGRGLPPPC